MHWIEDPGHGWLRVPLADYPDAIESGSGYGYVDSEAAYLEEDMEAADFLNRHPEIDAAALESRYVPNFNRNRRRVPRNITMATFRERWYGQARAAAAEATAILAENERLIGEIAEAAK